MIDHIISCAQKEAGRKTNGPSVLRAVRLIVV